MIKTHTHAFDFCDDGGPGRSREEERLLPGGWPGVWTRDRGGVSPLVRWQGGLSKAGAEGDEPICRAMVQTSLQPSAEAFKILEHHDLVKIGKEE